MISALDQTNLLAINYSASRAQDRAEVLLGELASGRQGSDAGAANQAIAAQLDALDQSELQASQNALQDAGVYMVADAALSTITSLSGQMRAMAVQAGNATLNPANRQAIDAAYQQLGQEVDRVAASTTFNGTPLLSGANIGAFQVGGTSGPESQLAANLPTVSAASLGLAGTSVATASSAGQALSRLDDALAGLSSARSGIGAGESALASAQSQTAAQALTGAAAYDRLAGTDYASVTAAYQQALLTQQSAYESGRLYSRQSVQPIAALVAG